MNPLETPRLRFAALGESDFFLVHHFYDALKQRSMSWRKIRLVLSRFLSGQAVSGRAAEYGLCGSAFVPGELLVRRVSDLLYVWMLCPHWSDIGTC